jgi:pimeloyl-ACP methyl ester carboxylesterase
MTMVTIPGAHLALTDTRGPGEPVILLHALAGNRASWSGQVGPFRQAGYRVVAFDRRGSGDTVTVEPTGSGGCDADDLVALMDTLGLRAAHVVAVAAGAGVAIDLAALHPSRVRSLVLAASTGMISEPEIVEFSKRIEIAELAWPSIHLEIGASFIGRSPGGVARWRAIEARSRRAGEHPRPFSSPNTFAKLASIDVPTLAVAGGSDLLAPPALMRIWVEHIPGSRFLVLPEVGHSMNFENPTAFNRIVLEFLDAGGTDDEKED